MCQMILNVCIYDKLKINQHGLMDSDLPSRIQIREVLQQIDDAK